jgi:hypothetical protein
VEVEIQKVDALRHQIDLAVILPEGDGRAEADHSREDDQHHGDHHNDPRDAQEVDPFAPIPVLSEA